jgi:hypothetical protein
MHHRRNKDRADYVLGLVSVPSSMRRSYGQAVAYVLLVAVLAAKYAPMFSGYVLPYHDTMFQYQNLHFFYSGLLLHHELPQWMPEVTYGLHSSLYFLYLGPCAYLIGLIGLLLGVHDTLFLFNLVMVFEELVYATGIFLLARRNFWHAPAVFLTGAVVILCSVNLRAPYHNILMLYATPMILYFLQLFFEEAKLGYLLAALNVFGLSLLGTTAYSLAVQSLPICVVTLVLALAHVTDWRRYLRYTRRDVHLSIVFLLTFVIFVAAYWVLVDDARRFVFSNSPGRVPGSSVVTLDTFLSWARFPDTSDVLDLVVPTLFPMNADYTIHVGIWCVIFAASSLTVTQAMERRHVYWAWCGALTLLTLLSLGKRTFVAEALYDYYPAMKYYRHVGYVIIYVTLFGPLLAGWGFDVFLARLLSPGGRPVARIASHGVVGLIVVLAVWQLSTYQGLVREGVHRNVATPAKESGIRRSLFAAYVGPFPTRRTDTPATDRARNGQYVTTWPASAIYYSAFAFTDWDACRFRYRWDMINAGVADLIRMRRRDLNSPDFDDSAFLAMAGCTADKLRLLPAARVARTLDEESSLLGSGDPDQPSVILVNAPGTAGRLPPATRLLDGSGVKIVGFTNNRLQVHVNLSGDNAAWLYYANAWHPYWKAEINGLTVPVYRANHAFQAVVVPPGRHSVVFYYDAPPVRLAMYALIACGVGWLLAGFGYVMSSPFVARDS